MIKESTFQAALIKRIKNEFPNSIVLKNDPNYIQGFPDLTVLLPNGKWAVLECKRSKTAHHQPNQDYYISKMSKTGFSRIVYPENEEEVLHDLQQTFGS